jgi:hypothetical protein
MIYVLLNLLEEFLLGPAIQAAREAGPPPTPPRP